MQYTTIVNVSCYYFVLISLKDAIACFPLLFCCEIMIDRDQLACKNYVNEHTLNESLGLLSHNENLMNFIIVKDLLLFFQCFYI